MKFNRIALLVLSLSAAWVVNAAEDLPASPAVKHVGAFERMDIRRADELLERATDYLQKYGSEQPPIVRLAALPAAAKGFQGDPQ